MISAFEERLSLDVWSVTQLIATKLGVADSMIGVFSDYDTVLEHIFGSATSQIVIAGGIVTPDVQLIAHRADKPLNEIVGASPFSSCLNPLLAEIGGAPAIVYLANPNRISGADWSISDLERIAQAIPDGLLVVDEFYHDYYGVSADPLLTKYANVVVLRSAAPAAGLSTSAGYLIATPGRIEQSILARVVGNPSRTDLSVLTECLYNTERLYQKLRSMHDEALRMIAELRRLGFQSRLTPYDRLVIKVADVAVAGNQLARHGVEVENLDGYPGMRGRVRIAIGSLSRNNQALAAFGKLAACYLEPTPRSRQKLEIRRKPETAPIAPLELPATRLERVKAYTTGPSGAKEAVTR